MEKSLQEAYLSLDRSHQALVLARVAHDLTLVLRGHYSDSPSEAFSAVARGQNELIHSLTGHLRDLLSSSPTYPEDVFLRILAEKAHGANLSGHLTTTFRNAVTKAAF